MITSKNYTKTIIRLRRIIVKYHTEAELKNCFIIHLKYCISRAPNAENDFKIVFAERKVRKYTTTFALKFDLNLISQLGYLD